MTPAELRARLRAGTVTPEICQAAADGWEAAEAEKAALLVDMAAVERMLRRIHEQRMTSAGRDPAKYTSDVLIIATSIRAALTTGATE